MPEPYTKNLAVPDETIRFPQALIDLVDLGDWTVARAVHQPGWRWSTHVRPLVGGEWCQARHLGVVLAGKLRIILQDGTSFDLGPNEVYDIPPMHDGFVVGDEPCEMIEWSGVRAFAGFRTGGRGRVLATLLLTDLCGATELAARLGDVAWRELLSAYYETARAGLERFRGQEVKTTGDGLLATFDGPAQALHFAAANRRHAAREGLRVRTGVHVGEVEVVGSDLRGFAVQEAMAIKGAAAEDEILVSEMTHVLTKPSGIAFTDRGTYRLDGLGGERRLFAYAEPDEPGSD